ncbi:MAG: hypothetical protein LBN71_08745 [Tannerella sp.]|jgi:hypothetical protein|nr:hypothetical protein [Tannerella sp.]
MKRIILSFLFVCLAHGIHAQRIDNPEAEAVGGNIRITFSLQSDTYLDLSLQYSENNGLTFKPCETVSGDLENQLSGDKSLLWDCGKDGIIMGDFVFKVVTAPAKNPPKNEPVVSDTLPEKQETGKSKRQEEKDKKRAEEQTRKQAAKEEQAKKQMEKQASAKTTVEKKPSIPSDLKGSLFLMPGVSIGNTLSGSLMAGYMKDWGGYAKFKSNFASKGTYETGGKNDGYYNSDYAKTGRLSISAGLTKRLTESCFLYAGAGYGSKWVQWETTSSQLVEITDLSYSGIEPEAGVIFKIRKFVISGGASLLAGKSMVFEANIAIGYTF